MPKLKSNRGAAKRFKRTASGRFRHRQSHKSHILTKKSAKRKRQLRPLIALDDSDVRAVRRLLPYV
ncbi:MAG: 50S ribosomal protein L35 [Gammaproteobacteria bacterium]|nr:50S ribosomal protein L35 [Gammaproteobacteria bacterium]MCI0591619.1 50S ribosomal protein L35 [Gammaproteobacteria bacterium]